MENDVHASDIKQLSFNKPQQLFMLALWRGAVRVAHSIWGRATGKSTVIALLIDMIVRTMPRSTWAIQGATFQQLLTLTLPGTFEGLEMLGYRRDKDFVIGKQPPKGYDLPYWNPLKYDRMITFLRPDKTCVAFSLVSQDREGYGRGPSYDGIIADESLTLNQDRFQKETKATNRGHDKYFGKHKLHHGIFHFSSMPYGQGGDWLLNAGAYYEQDGYNYSVLKNRLIELQLDFLKEYDRAKQVEIWKEIYALDQTIKAYASKAGVYYSEANSFDNIRNIGLNYIRDLKDGMTDIIFLIEVMNKHLKKVEEAFYPTFNRDIHGYHGDFNYSFLDSLDYDFSKLKAKSLDSRQDKDCYENLPLHIGMDFGSAINWIVVAQKLEIGNRMNFIKNFFVKSPKLQDDVCQDFCDYYKYHKRKEIYFWPDPAGNNHGSQSKITAVEQAKKLFIKNGWTVRIMNMNKKNVPHHDKYLLWGLILEHKDKSLPKIGFNLLNCKELIVSIEQSPSKDDGYKGMHKNKKSERLLKTNREEATDGSDAADLILYGNYRHLLRGGLRLPFQTSHS
jgi:hypothetical protein